MNIASRQLARIKPYLRKLRRTVTARRLLAAGAGLSILSAAVYVGIFYWPRQVAFSYADESCFTNPVLLPKLVTKSSNSKYDVSPANTISIGGYPIYAHGTCVTATEAPQEQHSEKLGLKVLGMPFEKTITVTAGKQPRIAKAPVKDTLVSTKDPVAFTLAGSDEIFGYELEANTHKAGCVKNDTQLRCDTSSLGLAQATAYEFTLWRTFEGKPVKPLFKQSMTTVEPIQVTATTINGGQVVYDTPGEMRLTFNKPVKELGTVRLVLNSQDVPITTSVSGNVATVAFKEPLARSASFTLNISDTKAPDGGFLSAPVSIPFQTSGGPKVAGVNIGSAKVQAGGTITLTFDVPLAAGQDLSKFIKVESGAAVAASITANGRSITLRPDALPRCAAFTVRVLDGLKNEYGVSGGSAWSFKSRILCQTTFSIGTSVQGRSITAYRFGDGPNKIIFVGGTHGDERSSVQILQRWIDQLELNPTRIPAHQTIIVIPNLNPDGYASNRRTNANNVDLNRNFPSNNWKSGVTMPDKSYLEHGGGTEPLSEPESRALANYVLSQSPRLVLTYHAAGNVVVPNDSGDSGPIAVEYGKKSTVGYMSSGSTGTFFEYDTTGAFEDWLHDKPGLPALLIELKSRTSNDFSGHVNALWYIAGL